ncbi:MAG TPA: hypothetical protein PL102_01520 [Candidatus Syntrophosphaera sp.]|nr:hypothetical protein [Candidatus Cloacimonadota bacterium]HPB43092.1 hypothetical protein [Candidatus Syntrophosphaera sp.]
MPVTLTEVKTRRDMKRFVYLPEVINAGRPGWVPPLYDDDKAVLNPKKNPALSYCDTVYMLAWKDGKCVGRVAPIINHKYNDYAKVKTGRFGWFDAIDDLEVVKALVDFAEKWLKERGMTRIVGPMGFTEEDPEGFIFMGYHENPTLACYQNTPIINEYMEKLGYGKEIDWFVYKLDMIKAMSPLYKKLFERASRSSLFRLKEFKSKKEINAYIRPVIRLMNECFVDIYGYSPLSDEDVEHLAKRYMPLLEPRFIKVVETPEKEVIGFMVSIPNFSPGIVKARGRLFPFGFIHILNAAKTTTQLDNYLGAVKAEYRGKGVDILMGYAQMKTAVDAGFKIMDSHHEMEDNIPMRAEMERSGGEIYKKFRLYSKDL